jgi:hypothetical protein
MVAPAALLLGACSAGGGPSLEEPLSTAPDGGVAATPAEGALAAGDEEPLGGTLGGPAVPQVGPSVIKTAELEVEVPGAGFRDAVDRATRVAAQTGGFLVSSSVDDAESRRGTVVMRVPSESFEQALSELRDLGEVQEEEVSGEDVSQKFVDLEARLRNARTQEAVLLRLFDEATSIQDTIRIQGELSDLQLDIEALRGRLRFLRDRAAMGTITLDLVEAGVLTEEGLFRDAWDTALAAMKNVVAGLISALGVLVPLGVLAAIGLGVWGLVRRRRTRTVPASGGA